MINLLLVDDHPSVRHGTKAMLEEDGEYRVMLASTGEEAMDIIDNEPFNLYIFDLFLPTCSGLDLTKYVVTKESDAIVLIYTGFDVEPHYNLLIEAGISGFISKTASKDQLVTAIKCALRKEAVVPTSFLRQLRRSEFKSTPLDVGGMNITLTEREQEVLFEASKGKTNKEIAQKLLLSQRMVEYHLSKIFSNLKVSSRGEAVARARELRLLPSELITTNDQ